VKGFLSPKDGAFEKQSLICLATNDFDSSAEEIVSLYFNRARADEYRPRFLPFSHGKSGKISFFAKNANRSEGAKAVSSLIFFLHSLMEFQAAKDLNDPSEIKS
jgi:hypothetical protein